jgi:hypothetical protein
LVFLFFLSLCSLASPNDYEEMGLLVNIDRKLYC